MTVNRAKEDLCEDGKLKHLFEFSKDEKQAQVRDYLDENPDASNREVAESIEADVSHATVGNWRNENSTRINDREERTELVRYVEEEKSYRKAGIVTRAKWWLTGMDDD